MTHKKHLYVGNYSYNRSTGKVRYIAGWRAIKYFSNDDWYWGYIKDLWNINCKSCIKKLLNANTENIAEEKLLDWRGKVFTDFSPQLFPMSLG